MSRTHRRTKGDNNKDHRDKTQYRSRQQIIQKMRRNKSKNKDDDTEEI